MFDAEIVVAPSLSRNAQFITTALTPEKKSRIAPALW